MLKFKPSFVSKVFALLLALVMASFFVFPFNGVAQTGLINEIIRRWELLTDPPPQSVPSNRREGGAGRGELCFTTKSGPSMLALLPVREIELDGELLEPENVETRCEETDTGNTTLDISKRVGGYTTEMMPTFWFYLPYILKQDELVQDKTLALRVAQFALLNQDNQSVLIEQIAFELSDTPQLIEYSLPYALETNQLYSWYFSVICDPEKPSRNPSVRGWVQRKPIDELQVDLRNANFLREYEVYGEQGIWFEAVNYLVKSRREFPSVQKFRQDWIGLLRYFCVPEPERLDSLVSAEPKYREIVNIN